MSYAVDSPVAIAIPIGVVDAGKLVASGSTKPSVTLGTIVRGNDPTYGNGEFIFLLGVASTAVGTLVVYDGTTFATTRCPVTSSMGRPLAVAMQASTASQWGWYQISGTAVISKSTSSKFVAKAAMGIKSTGKVGSLTTLSGKQVLGAFTANTATVASATTTVVAVIQRPHAQGQAI